MAWPVRLEPSWHRNPKLRQVGPLGRLLWVLAVSHCTEFLTDGWLSLDELKALERFDGVFVDGVRGIPGVYEPPLVEDVMESNIRAGLFEYLDERVHVHDFVEHQSSREKVLAQREKWRADKNGQRAGFSKSKAGSSNGDSERKGLEEVHTRAREALLCPACGPMPFKTERQLQEHIENVHPEFAEAVPHAS